MLRLLQSNQPAAWVIVPLTAALLVLCRVMGMQDVDVDAGSALVGRIAVVGLAW